MKNLVNFIKENYLKEDAPASTFRGTGRGQQTFSDLELQNQMRQNKRTGLFGGEVSDENQSQEYLDAKAELARRRGETSTGTSSSSTGTQSSYGSDNATFYKGIGVDSTEKPEWVDRWAAKWGDDPAKVEGMRQQALANPETRAFASDMAKPYTQQPASQESSTTTTPNTKQRTIKLTAYEWDTPDPVTHKRRLKRDANGNLVTHIIEKPIPTDVSDQISPQYWITHQDFENAYGHPYDAFSETDRKAFFRLADTASNARTRTEGPATDYHAIPSIIRPNTVPVMDAETGMPSSWVGGSDERVAPSVNQGERRKQQAKLESQKAEAEKRSKADAQNRAEMVKQLQADLETSPSRTADNGDREPGIQLAPVYGGEYHGGSPTEQEDNEESQRQMYKTPGIQEPVTAALQAAAAKLAPTGKAVMDFVRKNNERAEKERLAAPEFQDVSVGPSRLGGINQPLDASEGEKTEEPKFSPRPGLYPTAQNPLNYGVKTETKPQEVRFAPAGREGYVVPESPEFEKLSPDEQVRMAVQALTRGEAHKFFGGRQATKGGFLGIGGQPINRFSEDNSGTTPSETEFQNRVAKRLNKMLDEYEKGTASEKGDSLLRYGMPGVAGPDLVGETERQLSGATEKPQVKSGVDVTSQMPFSFKNYMDRFSKKTSTLKDMPQETPNKQQKFEEPKSSEDVSTFDKQYNDWLANQAKQDYSVQIPQQSQQQNSLETRLPNQQQAAFTKAGELRRQAYNTAISTFKGLTGREIPDPKSPMQRKLFMQVLNKELGKLKLPQNAEESLPPWMR